MAKKLTIDELNKEFGVSGKPPINKNKSNQNNKGNQNNNKGKQNNSASSAPTSTSTKIEQLNKKFGVGGTSPSTNQKKTTQKPTDYSSAVKYLNDKGVKGASGIMTENEWRRRGRTGGTYQNYLDSMVAKYDKGTTDFNTESNNAYTSYKDKANTKTVFSSNLTDKERKARIGEIESEMRQLRTTLNGIGRAAAYGSTDSLKTLKEKTNKRIAELSEELKSLKRTGAFTASELKQLEIDDAKARKASLPQYNPTARITLAEADSYKKNVQAHYELDKEIETLERQKALYDKIAEFGNVVNDDDFDGQWRANYRSNEISREADKAMSEYIRNPTEENRQIAYAYDAFAKEYAKNNEKALDDENVKASWLTKSAAGYLPQFKDQIIPELVGGGIGFLLGTAVGAPNVGSSIGAGLGTYSQSYDVMRGSVYRTLLAEGVDEEIARQAASDEAFISSLIESGETMATWAFTGGTKAMSAIGNAAKSAVAKGSTNAATKFVANVATKATTKAATKAAAKATRPLWNKAIRAAGGIVGNAGTEYVEEFTQGAVSRANREQALASVEREIGQYGRGNIDLYNRPVYKNADGSISTVDSVTYQIDDKFVLLPTVVWTEKGFAKRLNTDEEILAHYKNTGEFLGEFDTLEEANAYATKLHSAQAYYYSDNKTVTPDDNLWSGGAKVIGSALSGNNPEALAELHEQGKEGFKIGLMFGTGQTAVNNTVSHVLNTRRKEASSISPYLEQVEEKSKKGETIFVEEAQQASGYGESGSKLLANAVNNATDKTFSEVKGEMHKAYMAGFAHKDMNLSTDLEHEAYLAGKTDRTMQDLSDKEKAKNASVYDSGVVQNKNFKKLRKTSQELLTILAKDHKTSVEMRDVVAAIVNGKISEANAQHSDGKILGSMTAEKPVYQWAIHEDGHRMEQLATEEWDAFASFAYARAERFGRATKKGEVQGSRFDTIKAQHDNAGLTLNTKGYVGEVVMRELEVAFSSEREYINFLAELKGESPQVRSGFQKFMDYLAEIIADIKKTLSRAMMSKEARAEADKDLAELEHFKELYGKAYLATRDAVTEISNAKTSENATGSKNESTSNTSSTQKESPLKSPIKGQNEKTTDRMKTVLGEGEKSVGVSEGQAYVSNGNIFIPVKRVNEAKTELGAKLSVNVANSVSKLLKQSSFVPINKKPVEGNLKGIGTVRVFTDANGREIALKIEVAEYLEGYNLEATFRGGKPYAIKATDNNGNVVGVAMAIGMSTSGQKYELTDTKKAKSGIQQGDVFTAKKTGTEYKIVYRDDKNTTVEISSAEGTKTMVISNEIADSNFSNMSEEGITKWIDEDLHIDNRSWEDVSDRKVKAFQFLFPEFQEYYTPLAMELLGDLQHTIKGERIQTGTYETGTEWTGISRLTSDAIARIKDTTNATYDDIRNALERLINDEGQENIALAKKIELVFDEMLTDGYTTFDGTQIQPNEEYIAKKEELLGKTADTKESETNSDDDWSWMFDTGFSLKDARGETKSTKNLEIKINKDYNGNTNYSLKDGQYTASEYRKFGWARANNILNAGQNADYRSKFADAKVGRAKFYKSKQGEYIIPVSDIYDPSSEGIDNVLVFAKGTISNPIITSVIEIYGYNETTLDRVRRRIYDCERRGIQQKTGELFRRYNASDFEFRPNQQRASSESVRNSGNNGHRERSGGETSSAKGKTEVSYSLKDSEYLELAKDPKKNEAKLRAMVEDAAEQAGYIGTYYHGSKSDFTVFKKELGGKSNSNAGIGFWFTESEEGAKKWADESWWGDNEESKVYKTYLRLSNPKVYETVDTKSQRDELKKGYESIDKEMSLYDSIYHFEDGRRYHTERFDYDESKRRSLGVAEWRAFEAIVKKLNSKRVATTESASLFTKWMDDEVDYYLAKVPESERQTVQKDADRYFELSQERKALDKQITELRYYDAYELFRTDMYKQIGLGAEDANIGGTGKYVENKEEMLKKYVDMLKQEGYDGIIIKNTSYDTNFFGEHNNQYLVFDSNQVKSAEPVTYDNKGEVISLSERFNEQSDDIRYSLKDSDGNTLTEAQQVYFKDSKIRDENGNLLVVYHGSPAKFTVFNHNRINAHGNAHGRGFYFTEKRSKAEGYEQEGGQLLKGYLNITNPASEDKVTIKKTDLLKVIKALCKEQAEAYVKDGEYDNVQDAILDSWISNYVYTYGMSLNEAYKEVTNIIYSGNTSDVHIISELTNAGAGNENVLRLVRDIVGYDGVIYTADDGSHEYVSFESNQFKNSDNANPTSDPDINFSLKEIKEKYADKTDHLYIYEKKNTISIDNMVVKKEYRNPGIGTDILNDIIAYADRVQKTITLTPTSEFGTKERLKKWYKANGFVENKGRNTDFTISDTMYRLPSDVNFSLKEGKTSKRFDQLVHTIEDVEKGKKGANERLYKYVDSGVIPTEVYDNLVKQYGAIRTGEKPHREVQVPQKTAENKKVSQTVRTILEAEVTPDEAVPTIQKMVEDGIFSYDAYTDKQAIADAENYLKEYGWDESLDDWFDAVEKGEVSKELTTMGWALYNNAANIAATTSSETERTSAIKTSLKILDAMVRHQRSAAQALQATRILKSLSPETQLYGVQRSVHALQNELSEKYGDKAPDLKIDEQLAEQFINAKTEEERAEIEKEIYKDIGRQMPSRFMDKWNAWRYLAMLGNPRTHIRNVFGNMFFAPVVATKNLTATAIESVVYRVSGKKTLRGKSMVWGNKADRALLKAAWNDYSNVADIVSNGGKYNDSAMANQHIEDGRKIFKSKLFAPVEWLRKGNSKLLEREDMIFSKPHYAYALAQYCKANNITPEQISRGKAISPARDYAIKEAQKATYRDTNAFSQMVSEWGRNGNNNNVVKKAFNTAIEGILPFRKTPANILVRGVEYSPLGLLKGLSYDLYQVGKGKMSANQAIDNISAGLTGTGLLALGVYLAAQGLIRGHGEEEKDEKEFKEMMGHQAYALELPNGQSITLDWLAPEALPFFVGVNIWEATKGKDKKVNLSTILKAVSSISEPMLELSCLQSLNDVFESVGNASSNDTSGLVSVLSSAVTSYLTQGLPTLFGQAERSGEEYRMTTYTEKNDFLTGDMQYTFGKMSAKIPFWDYNQIPYIDAWGRKEASGTALKRGLNNFLNPAYTSTIESSAMEKELLRLYENTGETKVFPSRAAKYFMVDKVRKDLTAEEYVKYATLLGEKSYKLVTELVNSKAYKNLSDEEKIIAIDDAYQYATQKAKQAISNYKPDKWVSEADAFGDDVEKYFSFYAAVSDTKADNGGKITKKEIIDIILDTAENDSDVWNMYSSQYDYKELHQAQKVGIDAKLYITTDEAMYNIKADYMYKGKRVDGNDLTDDERKNAKVINGSKKAKIVKYLNSVCTNERDYMFLLGTEYDSVTDDYAYTKYFGK